MPSRKSKIRVLSREGESKVNRYRDNCGVQSILKSTSKFWVDKAVGEYLGIGKALAEDSFAPN